MRQGAPALIQFIHVLRPSEGGGFSELGLTFREMGFPLVYFPAGMAELAVRALPRLETLPIGSCFVIKTAHRRG